MLVPLPPLAEQRRIVARVDELMALCDQLAAAHQQRETTRDRFASASLARLNQPDPDPPTFHAHAAFALDNLAALTTRPDQVTALRQTILNLAVRGKLVPQDASDEPAAELLKRIAAEKARLVEAGEIKREKALLPITDEALLFDLPVGWTWSRVGDVALFTQYGTSQKSEPITKGVPVLTMGNIQDGSVIYGNEKRIPETSDDLPALYLRNLDILYNRTNSAELVGKTGIYLGEDEHRTFASYLIRIRLSHHYVCPYYLNLAMNAPQFRETQIVPLIKKQTGQANVNGTALRNMLIPLPPLAEQRRIVARVDELMALCDRLEASLSESEHTRRRLLDALLHAALAPEEGAVAGVNGDSTEKED
jgi:type I restriction enzyme S subunit